MNITYIQNISMKIRIFRWERDTNVHGSPNSWATSTKLWGHVIFIENSKLQSATTLFPSFSIEPHRVFLRRSTYKDSI